MGVQVPILRPVCVLLTQPLLPVIVQQMLNLTNVFARLILRTKVLIQQQQSLVFAETSQMEDKVQTLLIVYVE
jgi:hypothetical protein